MNWKLQTNNKPGENLYCYVVGATSSHGFLVYGHGLGLGLSCWRLRHEIANS